MVSLQRSMKPLNDFDNCPIQVSGLPIKNDIRHVGEIASMSLDLLSAVRQHKISHRPNETLKLRIGMN